jgi:Zn-dependent protease with chaperone function
MKAAMADAVFYDGQSARPRTVCVRITSSSLDLHEGAEWIASWPLGEIRRRDAPEGILRLTREGAPSLVRLDVGDAETQAAIRQHCRHLDDTVHRERTGRILFWSAAAAVSILLCVFVLLPILADRLTPLIPASYERRLGTAVDNQIRTIFSGKVCKDPQGLAALEALVAQMRGAQGSQVDVDVMVLESTVPNAIALPGGRIYLFEELLDQAQSVDEVAGVLGHEMGHVAHRDSLRLLIQAGSASYLLGLLFGDVTGGGAIVLASRHLVESSYSREAEAAADDYSGRAMIALGRAASPVARLLQRIEGRNKLKIPAFLSTHPLTEQRLKALEKLVPARPGPPLLSDEEWRSLKDICKTT